MEKRKDELQYLNILRFIGAVCIAIFLHWNDHIIRFMGLTNPFEKTSKFMLYISKNSFVFVEMFFIISGILFSKVYIDRILNKKYNLNSFLHSRYVRIFPLVIISSIVMYFLHLIYFNKFGAFFSGGNLKIVDLFFDITIGGTVTIGTTTGSVNSPIWYIGVLFLCYAIAYGLTLLYKKNKGYLIFVLPILIGIFILKTGFNFFIFNFYVARGLCAFFVGILLGNGKVLEFLSNHSIKTKIFYKLFLFLILILFSYFTIYDESGMFVGGYVDTLLYYTFIFFPIIILLLYDIKSINDFGKNKIVRFLGNISFDIYIWNYPIMIIEMYLINIHVLNVNVCSYKFILVNALIHIIVGALSYIFIENRLVNKIKMKSN